MALILCVSLVCILLGYFRKLQLCINSYCFAVLDVQISLPSTDSITMETTPPAVPVSTPSKVRIYKTICQVIVYIEIVTFADDS